MSIDTTTDERLQRVLNRLHEPRERGGKFQARCPAHEDNRASLSVGAGDNGGILLHCHAGCATRDIVAKLGLEMIDLAPPDFRPANGHANGNGKPRIAREYDYRDEAGKLLYQGLRMDPKDFKQRAPKEGGGWDWSVKGVRKVPYRLRELIAAGAMQQVFICEGEKDCDRLAALGLVATTNVGGAGKWLSEYNEFLRDRHVVILVDNDDAGRKHGQQIIDSLRGIAASVRIIELPELPHKGDVSDYLDAGHTKDELLAIVGPIELQIVNCTDLGNAKRLVRDHGQDLRYCHPRRKWIHWTGKLWPTDETGEVYRRAKATIGRMLRDGTELSDKNARRDLIQHALDSESKSRIEAMVSLAQSEAGVPIMPEQFDADPMLLNVANGTLELLTGTLRPARRGDYITKLAPVAFDAKAECPTWLAFLARTFESNAPVTGFMQRWLGYCLTARTNEQKMPIFYGCGANGKSTLLNAMLEIMGDYGMRTAPHLLAVKGNAHPTELADLCGKRLAVANESEEGQRLAESLTKDLTGGDKIRARGMRENFWEFVPSHKIILPTNHRPAITGTDHAIWRRVVLVPFNVTIPESQQDKQLPEKLRREYPGILRWLVDGCLAWQRDGLGMPEEIQAATAEYRAQEDQLGEFLTACCVMDRHASATATAILEAYREFSGHASITQVKLSRLLKDRGFHSDRFSAGRNRGRVGWFGVGLLSQEHDAREGCE